MTTSHACLIKSKQLGVKTTNLGKAICRASVVDGWQPVNVAQKDPCQLSDQSDTSQIPAPVSFFRTGIATEMNDLHP